MSPSSSSSTITFRMEAGESPRLKRLDSACDPTGSAVSTYEWTICLKMQSRLFFGVSFFMARLALYHRECQVSRQAAAQGLEGPVRKAHGELGAPVPVAAPEHLAFLIEERYQPEPSARHEHQPGPPFTRELKGQRLPQCL